MGTKIRAMRNSDWDNIDGNDAGKRSKTTFRMRVDDPRKGKYHGQKRNTNEAKGANDEQKSEGKQPTKSRARTDGEGEKHFKMGENNSWHPPLESKDNKSSSGEFSSPATE